MFYEEIFKQLNRRHIDYTVVGGVALVMHGVVRLTADLDLMLYLDEKNLSKFIDLKASLAGSCECFCKQGHRRQEKGAL